VTTSATVPTGSSTTALLFEADEATEVQDWASELAGLGRKSILWVDVQRPDEDLVRELVDTFELADRSAEALGRSDEEPFFADFGSYLHVTARAPCRGEKPHPSHELETVSCLVAKRWVITVHDGRVPMLENFRERASGSGDTGRLDGLEFLAGLLAWVLEGYLDAFEEVELALEELDSQAMEGVLEPDEALPKLVALRKEVGLLRRALVSHRELLLSLMRPELAGMSSEATADRFADLRATLEDAAQAARDSRDSIMASFDVLIARTGYRTNEIMKVLTLASVLLLPGALIAGVLGMNFEVGLFDHSGLFWVVIVTILGIAGATMAAARLRGWI
jgi:magnesium transporter